MFVPWKVFADKVRILLTVDGVRKGSFTQKYIDQITRASVLDLQSYVPSLKPLFSRSYAYGDLTHASTVSKGDFSAPATTVISVHVGRTSGLQSRARVTYESRQQKLPITRADGKPNVSFRSCLFEVRPALVADESLLIRYQSEVSHFEDNDLVPYDERCVKIVAGYVKAHLAREIDKDLSLYTSYMEDYLRERAIYHLDRAEYVPECMDDKQVIKYTSEEMSLQSQNVVAAENLFRNDLISLSPLGAVRAKATPGVSADGFVIADFLSGAASVVYFEGTVPGAYEVGARYYLSSQPGASTKLSPSQEGEVSQFVGKALTEDELNFEPDQPVFL